MAQNSVSLGIKLENQCVTNRLAKRKKIVYCYFLQAPVVQWIECLTTDQKVPGSTPGGCESRSMNISQFLCIAWCANALLDTRSLSPFTFDEIYEAAHAGKLVDLFLKIDQGNLIKLYADELGHREEMERYLGSTAISLQERELRKLGVGDNPLCMTIAIVLQVVRDNFRDR